MYRFYINLNMIGTKIHIIYNIASYFYISYHYNSLLNWYAIAHRNNKRAAIRIPLENFDAVIDDLSLSIHYCLQARRFISPSKINPRSYYTVACYTRPRLFIYFQWQEVSMKIQNISRRERENVSLIACKTQVTIKIAWTRFTTWTVVFFSNSRKR